jgi:DNA-binding FadR family transcriptional regulator
MNRRLGMVADKAFHVHISNQAENPVLSEFHKKLFDAITFTRALEGFSLKRAEAAIAEHDAIVAAMHGSSQEHVVETVEANVINGRTLRRNREMHGGEQARILGNQGTAGSAQQSLLNDEREAN